MKRCLSSALRLILPVSLTVVASGAQACSVCIAHALGAAMHGIGAQTLQRHKTVVGLTYLTFDKSNGTETPGITENESYQELLFDVNYGLTDRLLLRAALPFVNKSIRETGQDRESARGVGDASLGATYQLRPSAKGNMLTAFSLDLKLPTGENRRKDDTGDLREQHLQVGTGSTDLSGGVSFTWEGRQYGHLWFAGLRARVNGSNNRGYQYGNALFYDMGYVHPLDKSSALVFELNGRIVAKDVMEDGAKDSNSGGHLAYFSLSYRRELFQEYGLILTYQHPIVKQLNGSQEEKGLFSVSISKNF